MATVTGVEEPIDGKKGYVWSTFDENDTLQAAQVAGGAYTVAVEGAFGGTSIEIKYGKEAGNEQSIDVTNLTFTSDGAYNIEIGRGSVLPVRTGGSSVGVKVTLMPIPR